MNTQQDVEAALDAAAGMIEGGQPSQTLQARALVNSASKAAPSLGLAEQHPLHARIAALGDALEVLEKQRRGDHGPAGEQGRGGHVLFPG